MFSKPTHSWVVRRGKGKKISYLVKRGKGCPKDRAEADAALVAAVEAGEALDPVAVSKVAFSSPTLGVTAAAILNSGKVVSAEQPKLVIAPPPGEEGPKEVLFGDGGDDGDFDLGPGVGDQMSDLAEAGDEGEKPYFHFIESPNSKPGRLMVKPAVSGGIGEGEELAPGDLIIQMRQRIAATGKSLTIEEILRYKWRTAEERDAFWDAYQETHPENQKGE